MSNIFNLPLDQIDAHTIRDFVAERNPETINLEYKRELNDRVHRAVAAMANTYGGLILVGVAEKNGLPNPELVGVPLEARDRLVSKCFSKIEPPYEPEIAAVPINRDRYVLVIRVEIQTDRPLVVDGTVYIRLSGRTEPADRYRMATLFAEQGSPAVFGVPNIGPPRGSYAPLQPDEEALIVRALIRTRVPPGAAATLNSEVRNALLERLQGSRLERWIAGETTVVGRAGLEHHWRRGGFITHSIETVQRRFAGVVGEDVGLAAQSVMDLSASRHAGGSLQLAVDLILRHQSSEQPPNNAAADDQAPPTYRLSLEQLVELLDVSLGTALDEVAATIFPVITGVTHWPVVGAVVGLDTGVTPLSRYVAIRRFPRAEGAQDRSGPLFDVPFDVDVRDLEQRRRFLLEWLAQMLYNDGYTNFEPHLAEFAP